MAKEMKRHYGVLFTRNSGKIVKTLAHEYGDAFLRMFALQGNVSKTRDYVVFDCDGNITFYAEGKENDVPTIYDNMVGKHIDEIAEGLLEALNAEN